MGNSGASTDYTPKPENRIQALAAHIDLHSDFKQLRSDLGLSARSFGQVLTVRARKELFAFLRQEIGRRIVPVHTRGDSHVRGIAEGDAERVQEDQSPFKSDYSAVALCPAAGDLRTYASAPLPRESATWLHAHWNQVYCGHNPGGTRRVQKTIQHAPPHNSEAVDTEAEGETERP